MKFHIPFAIVFCLALFFSTAISPGIEQRALAEVPAETLTSDTQVQLPSEDDHLSLVWWIPHEYWQSIMARDATTPEVQKKAMLDLLKDINLVGVVQADISDFGAFKFYDKQTVTRNLAMKFKGKSGAVLDLKPVENIGADLQVLLDTMTPMLTAAMGNMGSNFHFFVYPSRGESGNRLVDPYKEGILGIQTQTSGGQKLTGALMLPLNSLYKPRLCPNGREAHVTWKFCPWTGQALPE